MNSQQAIVAVLRSQGFSTPTVRGVNFHDVYYLVTAGETLPVVLYLPQTGYHINAAALEFLRSSEPSIALRICEALLAQDCEPVDLVPTLTI